MNTKFKVAFVNGKLGDVDGVSLEVEKWIWALQQLGHEIYTIAGFYQKPLPMIPRENQFELPIIHFNSEFQKDIEPKVFPYFTNNPPYFTEEQKKEMENSILVEGHKVQNHILNLIKEHNIDVLIGQNTNAMPMSLASMVGMYLLSTKHSIATIYHHHDFWWERSRFTESNIEALLVKMAPPKAKTVRHVVISSYAKHTLQTFKRLNATVIPNCEDFTDFPAKDDYNADFRKDLGFKEDDIIILQPTRVVPRKRIEDSIRLVARYQQRYPEHKARIRFVISLYQGDEPDVDYFDNIKNLGKELDVDFYLISDRIGAIRSTNKNGKKMYSNRDAIVHSDLVTYLPIWEGFGNALLETIAARIPIIITTYLVYKTDIKPTGLTPLEVRDVYDEDKNLLIEEEILEQMHRTLTDANFREEMVENNFNIAQKEFSYDTLLQSITQLFSSYSDEIKASRHRLNESKKTFSV